MSSVFSSKMATRREALAAMAAGLAAPALRAAELAPSSLDHWECWVSNVKASADFYSRLFGADRLKNKRTERRYVKLGNAYVAMDQNPQQPIQVDHFCAGIPNFQIAAVHDLLNQRSIPFRDYPSGRDTAITDPAGMKLQLAADHGWEQLVAGTGEPEPFEMAAAPVFTVVGIESIVLRVTDLAASTAFFEKVLGASKSADDGRWLAIGASRLGLRRVRAGEMPAVDSIRLTARPFSANEVLPAISRMGAKEARSISANEVEFRDPDGYRMRVATV